jgi:hypothetical protein
VYSGILKRDNNRKKIRRKPKLIWKEALKEVYMKRGTKRRLEKYNVPKDLALNRSAWNIATHC